MKDPSDLQPLTLQEDPDTGDRFVLYAREDGAELELRFEGEEPWATQKQMADLFGRDISVISRHLSAIFDEGELDENSNLQKMQIADSAKPVALYGLDAILAVGYRVSSKQGMQFRRWANAVLRQYLIKGFVIDSRRLKGKPDRITELRRIIQDIRADETNIYAELRRILSMCRDYDPKSEDCQQFFAAFQNRLLYAITGQTAAGILLSEADASKPQMGLQSWDGEHPLQDDALTSKNYLGKLQIEDLNRLVTMVLDFFEDQTERGWLVCLADADLRLTEILAVNRRKILPDGRTPRRKLPRLTQKPNIKYSTRSAGPSANVTLWPSLTKTLAYCHSPVRAKRKTPPQNQALENPQAALISLFARHLWVRNSRTVRPDWADTSCRFLWRICI